MASIVLIGTQWGDEGKGKVVDVLAPHFDAVARFQGGHNAGHTVVVGGRKIVLRLVPSGIAHAGKQCFIGNGVVFDPAAFFEELDELRGHGLSLEGRLFVSDRAHVILPYHRSIEIGSEAAKGARKIGTTSRGIGPCYENKMARTGIRVSDLLQSDALRQQILLNLEEKNRILEFVYQAARIDPEPIIADYQAFGARLRPFVANTSRLLNQLMDRGGSVLFEGAQATMLDVDHGTYPFVTSSNASAGGACSGLGIGPTRIEGVLGITKAYATRVGSGPFPTELHDAVGAMMQSRGGEYGAVTGRPRRCGWFDLVVARYSRRVNGLESLAVTKLDVLDQLESIEVCVGYRLDGATVDDVPAEIHAFERCQPIYETLPGWQQPTTTARSEEDLPSRARDYLRFLGEQVGCEIGLVSTGADRDEVVLLRGSKLRTWLQQS
ncbi:MAG TPA: adenylosuccinate synthase [Acidobacteriota bacterium]